MNFKTVICCLIATCPLLSGMNHNDTDLTPEERKIICKKAALIHLEYKLLEKANLQTFITRCSQTNNTAENITPQKIQVTIPGDKKIIIQ